MGMAQVSSRLQFLGDLSRQPFSPLLLRSLGGQRHLGFGAFGMGARKNIPAICLGFIRSLP